LFLSLGLSVLVGKVFVCRKVLVYPSGLNVSNQSFSPDPLMCVLNRRCMMVVHLRVVQFDI
jgi:hypothetical protein